MMARCLLAGIGGLLLATAARADGTRPEKPLDLLLTREELNAIANRYVWVDPDAGKADELE